MNGRLNKCIKKQDTTVHTKIMELLEDKTFMHRGAFGRKAYITI